MAVLLVEDDPALARLLQTLVAREHMAVDVVTRGDEALKAIEGGRYLAIVLDLMLPVMSGFEVMRQLSARRPEVLSRIIVLTAVSQSQLEEFRYTSAIWRLMRKPFEVPDFIRTLRECVATHAALALPDREELTSWLAAAAGECGAGAAVLSAISGRELVLRATFGYDDGVAEEHFPLALSERFPLCIAARTGRPVRLASLQVTSPEFPLLLPLWTMNQRQALAAIPLLRNGMSIGAICWSFAEPQRFDEAQCAMLSKMADACVAMIPVEAQRSAESA